MFVLDKQLAKDCVVLGRFDLSRLLLMNDANYPWLVLVPEINGVTELNQLEWCDQLRLMREINVVSGILRREFQAEKLNVAALGNLVPQLHVHCIARYKTDAVWPKPVWGQVDACPYGHDELAHQKKKIIAAVVDLVNGDPEVSFT